MTEVWGTMDRAVLGVEMSTMRVNGKLERPSAAGGEACQLTNDDRCHNIDFGVPVYSINRPTTILPSNGRTISSSCQVELLDSSHS